MSSSTGGSLSARVKRLRICQKQTFLVQQAADHAAMTENKIVGAFSILSDYLSLECCVIY